MTNFEESGFNSANPQRNDRIRQALALEAFRPPSSELLLEEIMSQDTDAFLPSPPDDEYEEWAEASKDTGISV